MESVQVFNYNNQPISFQLGNGDILTNATEMAKVFDKKPIDWLRLPSTTSFLDELSKVRKSHTSPIQTVKGSPENGGGTWMHEDVALEFARWLSPAFAIWCNDRIKELLRHGATAVNADDLLNPDFIIKLASQLKAERAERERLQVTNELQAGELKQIAPKVEFYENVMQSDSLILTTTIAKELGMAAVTLNKMLHSMGIIYKTNDNWILTSRYQNKGYTGTKTYPFADRSGEIKTRINTLWTQKGREFIHKVIKGELVFN